MSLPDKKKCNNEPKKNYGNNIWNDNGLNNNQN